MTTEAPPEGASLELVASLTAKVESAAASMTRQLDDIRSALAHSPVRLVTYTASAVANADGVATLAFAGFAEGYSFGLRRIMLNQGAAGQTVLGSGTNVFLYRSTSLSEPVASEMFDYTSGLPAIGWYDPQQIVCWPGLNLVAVVTGLSAGDQVVGSAGGSLSVANEPALAVRMV